MSAPAEQVAAGRNLSLLLLYQERQQGSGYFFLAATFFLATTAGFFLATLLAFAGFFTVFFGATFAFFTAITLFLICWLTCWRNVCFPVSVGIMLVEKPIVNDCLHFPPGVNLKLFTKFGRANGRGGGGGHGDRLVWAGRKRTSFCYCTGVVTRPGG